MDLLYKSPKKEDEAICSYAHRIAYFNGFTTEVSFKKFLKKASIFLKVESSQNLSKETFGLLVNQRLCNSEKMFHYAYAGFPDREFICTFCWDEDPYIRSYWRDLDQCSCNVHNSPLLLVGNFNYGKESKFFDFIAEKNSMNIDERVAPWLFKTN